MQLALFEATATPARASSRHDFDRYDSPFWFLSHLLNYVKIEGIVGEPCEGSGNLSRLFSYIDGITEYWTNDLDCSVCAAFKLDASDPISWTQFPETDWIITNPPFNKAFPILQNAYNHARLGVIMFLRLSFMEPTEDRAQWLYEHPRNLDLIYPRFKFRKGKKGRAWQTDSVPMMAMVWHKHSATTMGSITVPKNHILGFYDNPENTPSFEEQIQYLRQVQKQ